MQTVAVSERERLFRVAAFFAVAVILHNADHVRRGVDSVSLDVFWTGTSAIALEALIVVLACARHRLAPLVSAAGGFALAAGYLSVHFLPQRGWLSDSFVSGGDVSPVSVVAALLELVAAAVVGVVGLGMVLRGDGQATADAGGSWRAGLVHPIAVVFIASQVAVLAVSFAQL